MSDIKRFIPMSPEELKAKGFKDIDVLLVTGDAYIDHPAFGVPLLARWLEKYGVKVAILAQPNFADCSDFLKFGRPNLFIGISSGTVDSMLNNYTANRKPRSDDVYSPGGKGKKRPDNACVVYAKLAREAFADVPIVLGGVEASLRRLAHYDYWQNCVKPSMLCEVDADLLAFGMGEASVIAIVDAFRKYLDQGKSYISRTSKDFAEALNILKEKRGFAYVTSKEIARNLPNRLVLPSYEEIKADKKKFARATLLTEKEANPFSGKKIVQYHSAKAVVINEQPLPLSTEEFDSIYDLPFTREPHPSYTESIPAFEMIKYSLTSTRGCYGGCAFCAITLHQGRVVQSRSPQSLIKELTAITQKPGFTGQVSDVGGPTANMYATHCKSENIQAVCKKLSCLYPKVCPHLVTSHKEQITLLKNLRELPKIKFIRIGSGIRYDLCFADQKYGIKYLREIISHHVGGQLKVAPEHVDAGVLALMRKPNFNDFTKFLHLFTTVSQEINKEQYVVPYFISGFPGCTPDKMKQVQQYLASKNWQVQQVQAFIPTPMTMATAMFYSGIDPVTKETIFVAKSYHDRKTQQAILQPQKYKNNYPTKYKK